MNLMPKKPLSNRSAKKSFYGPIWTDLKCPSAPEKVVLTTTAQNLKTAMKTNPSTVAALVRSLTSFRAGPHRRSGRQFAQAGWKSKTWWGSR
jgi:hypothetical protein